MILTKYEKEFEEQKKERDSANASFLEQVRKLNFADEPRVLPKSLLNKGVV
jgi:hypothetical protein